MEPIKKFQQTIEIQHYSKETSKSYKLHIERFRNYYGDNLTKENISRHLHYLTQKGYSPATINLTRASLLYYANRILKKEIKSDEIDTIKRPKPLPKPVNREIILELINQTKNLKHRILIEILYGSGLRLGEVIKIKWEDVDFTNGTLDVNKGKGNKDRIVKLGNDAITHLLDYKEQRYNKNNEYVFDSMARPHTHISKKTVQKVVENACNKAKIKPIRVHQIRHSYATHSLEDGVDIRKIQEALGHSSPNTTMMYTKVTKKTISQMVSPLDTLHLIEKNQIKGNKSVIESKVKSNSECNI